MGKCALRYSYTPTSLGPFWFSAYPCLPVPCFRSATFSVFFPLRFLPISPFSVPIPFSPQKYFQRGEYWQTFFSKPPIHRLTDVFSIFRVPLVSVQLSDCPVCPSLPFFTENGRKTEGKRKKNGKRNGFGWAKTDTDLSEMSACSLLYILTLLYCPAVFGHFSPAPVKTDRAVRIQ